MLGSLDLKTYIKHAPALALGAAATITPVDSLNRTPGRRWRVAHHKTRPQPFPEPGDAGGSGKRAEPVAPTAQTQPRGAPEHFARYGIAERGKSLGIARLIRLKTAFNCS